MLRIWCIYFFRITKEYCYTILKLNFKDKKHLKNVGPIRHCDPPLHCQSPGIASRTPAIAQAVCDVHDFDDDNA